MPELHMDTKAFQTCIQAEGGQDKEGHGRPWAASLNVMISCLEETTPESALRIRPTTFI